MKKNKNHTFASEREEIGKTSCILYQSSQNDQNQTFPETKFKKKRTLNRAS
jgi:hypothetical protein